MKVKIYDGSDTNLAPIVIAGNVPREEPSDVKLNEVRILEIAEFIRAEYITVFYRNNRKTTLSFTVARDHGDNFTAQQFIMDHPSSVPILGLVEMTLNGNDLTGGALTTTRWIENAGIGEVQLVEWKGSSTRFSYNIVGGKILNTKPKGAQ